MLRVEINDIDSGRICPRKKFLSCTKIGIVALHANGHKILLWVAGNSNIASNDETHRGSN